MSNGKDDSSQGTEMVESKGGVMTRTQAVVDAAADSGFILDDLAREGIGRGTEVLEKKSLKPLYRIDYKRFPVTSGAGQLAGAVGTKIHKLYDDATSHGPYKDAKVVTSQGSQVRKPSTMGGIPQSDRDSLKHKKGRKRGTYH